MRAGVLMCVAFVAVGCSNSNPTGPSSGSGDGTSGNPITVFITNSVYSPNPLTVKTGQFVNFKNNDSMEHSATFDNGSYESGNIPAFSPTTSPSP